MTRRREIALLGGSFNPPHVAHVMAAYWALATQGVDEVWLVPTYRHAFGKDLAPFEDRVRMCELAAAPLRRVRVCRAEEELRDDPLSGRMARTLEHLREHHPRRHFALVVGADILEERDRWYRWDRVEALARVVVIGRQGHRASAGLGPELPEISSTEVRRRIRRGEDVTGLVPGAVLRFIGRRALYR